MTGHLRFCWVRLSPLLIAQLAMISYRASVAGETTFWNDVYPLLERRCMGCHGGERPKGRLSVADFDALMKGGKKGTAVLPGKPDQSLLFQLINGSRKPLMPPSDEEPLDDAEIATVRLWIMDGANEGDRGDEAVPYGQPRDPPVYERGLPVTALLYSRQGDRLLVSGYREILVYRRLAKGSYKLEARWGGEAERILAMALSPDGTSLAAVGGSPARFGEAQLWDLESGSLRSFFRVGSDTLFALDFSPDGKHLAVGGTDRSIHLVDITQAQETYASEIHSDWILGLAFSADGTRLTSGGRDKTVKVSDAGSGKFVQTLRSFSEPVMRLKALPGQNLSLAGGGDSLPVLFDGVGLKEVRKLEKQPGSILALAVSQDAKLCAIGGSASEVRVYRLTEGTRMTTLKLGAGWTFSLAFHPGGKYLAVGGHDGTVRVFTVETGDLATEFVPAPIGTIELLQRF